MDRLGSSSFTAGGLVSGQVIRFGTIVYIADDWSWFPAPAAFAEGATLSFGSLHFRADDGGVLRLQDPAPRPSPEPKPQEAQGSSSGSMTTPQFVGVVYADSLLSVLGESDGYDSPDSQGSVAEVFNTLRIPGGGEEMYTTPLRLEALQISEYIAPQS